jgi:hypothetical protein
MIMSSAGRAFVFAFWAIEKNTSQLLTTTGSAALDELSGFWQ